MVRAKETRRTRECTEIDSVDQEIVCSSCDRFMASSFINLAVIVRRITFSSQSFWTLVRWGDDFAAKLRQN